MTTIDISTMFTVSIYMYMFMPPILPNALHNYTARLHDGAVRFGGGHVRVSWGFPMISLIFADTVRGLTISW
jgi:hypothetical protein